ncbi:hypothetical protein BGI37_09105 [Snodgrassella alvi]|jgi:hypothetical protein|nr:hypothetical protein BGI37_09105 [Snodgrassella alvi]
MSRVIDGGKDYCWQNSLMKTVESSVLTKACGDGGNKVWQNFIKENAELTACVAKNINIASNDLVVVA